MKRLILMRHGKAERSSPGGDFERRLTERGREDAALMGRLLRDEGLVPDLALVSSARRTLETWAEAACAFPTARMTSLKTLYHAPAERLLDEIEAVADEVETVMVVAHNPGIHELAIRLLIEGSAGPALIARAESRFPTATVAAFTIDPAGRAAYDGLFYVADHGGGGGE